MKSNFLFFVILTITFSTAKSQNVQQTLQDIWKEKTEWRQKAAEQNGRTPSTNNEKNLSDTNIIVSATADIQSEVHAAINPTDSNNIVVSSNFVATGGLFPPATNYIYYTKNFGQTWAKSNFVTAPLQSPSYILGGGDPNFVFTDSGKLYFTWINLWSNATFNNTLFDLYWASSIDGGTTWGRNPTSSLIGSAPYSIGGGPVGAFDKEWLATDKNPASPYYGNLYCSFLQASSVTNTEFIGVRHKTASGVFDTVSAQVNTNNNYQFIQFSSIAVDRTGGVHATFFASLDTMTYSIYTATSNDGGATFQPEVKISDVSLARYTSGQKEDSITGIDSSRLYPSPYIAADNTGGPYSNNLYMVWTANGTSSKLNSGNDVYYARSTDGGATWSTARILNDNTTNLKSDQYYPCITVGPTGRVVIMWWDRRDDTLNIQSNIYLTYSDDGGQTFIPDFKVTSMSTDFSTVGLLNGGFGIGEYNAVLAANDYIIPIWSDGRSNTGQMNLYSAFIKAVPGQSVGIQNISAVNGPLIINSVYPNPAKDVLNLSYESSEAGNMELSVYDVQGKLVLPLGNRQIAAAKTTTTINTSNLTAGTYLLRVVLNGTVNVREFVKEK